MKKLKEEKENKKVTKASKVKKVASKTKIKEEQVKVKEVKPKVSKKTGKTTKKEIKKKVVNKEENKKALKDMKAISKSEKKVKEPKKPRIYKEPNKSETETTINILYWKDIVSIYTNNVDLQKKLRKVLGKATVEDMRGRSIVASRWDVPMKEKNKLSQMILKANLFEL